MHPIEAGLPPLIEVLDEVAPRWPFDERWSVAARELLDEPAAHRRAGARAFGGVTLEHLRSLTPARTVGLGPGRGRGSCRAAPPAPVPPDIDAPSDAGPRTGRRWPTTAPTPSDKFLARPGTTSPPGYDHRVKSATAGETHAALTAGGSQLKWGHGRQPNWADLRTRLKESCKQLAGRRRPPDRPRRSRRESAAHSCYWIASQVRRIAHGVRADEGRLEFHDLLVLARNVLRDRPGRPSALHSASRSAAGRVPGHRPDPDRAGRRIAGGRDAGRQAPGRTSRCRRARCSSWAIPKQSIYRFRRADIALFLDAQRSVRRHRVG